MAGSVSVSAFVLLTAGRSGSAGGEETMPLFVSAAGDRASGAACFADACSPAGHRPPPGLPAEACGEARFESATALLLPALRLPGSAAGAGVAAVTRPGDGRPGSAFATGWLEPATGDLASLFAQGELTGVAAASALGTNCGSKGGIGDGEVGDIRGAAAGVIAGVVRREASFDDSPASLSESTFKLGSRGAGDSVICAAPSGSGWFLQTFICFW